MLIYVPLSQIDDNPFQRRSEYGDIEELASRIAAARESYPETSGLMQVPRGRVTVVDTDTIVDADSVRMFAKENKWNEDPKTFRIQLAFGHRRLRAFRHLHKSGAPGYEDGRFPIHIDPLTNKQMLDAVWAENYERKDISAVEQAELIRMKLDQLGPDATHTTIGEEWGLSRPVITNRLRLLELPDVVQQANRDGRLSERQALALKPIVEIDQLVNGRVEWGDKVGQMWGPPAAPAVYVEYVLENSDTVTSDDVRRFADKLINHAGEKLPGWLPKVKFDDVAGVEQAQCKGCPFRVNQSCLKPACLKKKLKAWPDMAVAAFVQESGIPVSDNDVDFRPFVDDVKLRQQLLELYAAGETENMVCGWMVGDSAARPHNKRSGSYVYNVANEEDCRCGVVLGYRGSLSATLDTEEPSGPVYEMPNTDDLAVWKEAADDVPNEAYKIMRSALSERLLHTISDWNIVQGFLFSPDSKHLDDKVKLSIELAKFLIEKGRGVEYAYRPYDTVQAYQTAVGRAGLKINVLGSAEDAIEKTAVLILSDWYNFHTAWNWEDVGNDTLERIAAWQQLPGAAASPMAEHVARAKRHIEQKLAAEGEEVETAVTCQHCNKRPANVTGEPYCDKCWQGELTDMLRCPSCNAGSTLPKNNTGDIEEECWSCHQTFSMDKWRGEETAVAEEVDA